MGLSSKGSRSLLQLGPHTAPEESADSIVLLIPEIPKRSSPWIDVITIYLLKKPKHFSESYNP